MSRTIARPFTGRHMLAVMLGFFGIVIAVNVTMAVLASRSFGGTVVDNSYVASQQFNTWLAAARAQRALGWQARVSVDAGRHVRVAGRLPAGATITGVARHPLGRIADQALRFRAEGDGSWRSLAALPAGRFAVQVEVRAGGQRAAFGGSIPA